MRVTFRHVIAALHLRVGMVMVVPMDGLRADYVLASAFATTHDEGPLFIVCDDVDGMLSLLIHYWRDGEEGD